MLKGTVRTAVVDRTVAQAFALKDWITAKSTGRVTTYEITAAGRAALKRILAGDDAARASGFAEAQTAVRRSAPCLGRAFGDGGGGEITPAAALQSCRKSRSPFWRGGKTRTAKPFLSQDLVVAGERLREDFELAQMGPRVAQNWGPLPDRRRPRRVLSGKRRHRRRVGCCARTGGPQPCAISGRAWATWCSGGCCMLEGLEAAERRLGWSARSGKIVLRIALMRLMRHYEGKRTARRTDRSEKRKSAPDRGAFFLIGGPFGIQWRSNLSASITLAQAATKSRTKKAALSSCA